MTLGLGALGPIGWGVGFCMAVVIFAAGYIGAGDCVKQCREKADNDRAAFDEWLQDFKNRGCPGMEEVRIIDPKENDGLWY